MSLRDDTKALLERHGLYAKKRFGQNFLVDAGVVADIADAALHNADLRVIEVGPGLGTLTRALLARGAEVRAIEKDDSLLPILKEELAGEKLSIVPADALKVDFREIYGPGVKPTIAGNIPYNISSPLLMQLIAHREVIGPVTLMVQKEVADRWMAKPGTKTYGSPSIMLQVFADIDRVRGVPPQCFLPPPKIDSMVVRLDWLPQPRVPVPDPVHFEKTVRTAFSQRRKTLRNSLKTGFEPEQIQRAEAVLDLQRRAETLSLAEMSVLAGALSALTS